MRLHVFPSTFSWQTYIYNVTSKNMMHTIAFMFYITAGAVESIQMESLIEIRYRKIISLSSWKKKMQNVLLAHTAVILCITDLYMLWLCGSYLVERFEGSGRFLVNFNLSVCLEPGTPCYLDVTILQDVYLPTTPCDWTTQLTSKDSKYRPKTVKVTVIIFTEGKNSFEHETFLKIIFY